MSELKEIKRQIALMVEGRINSQLDDTERMMTIYALDFAEDPSGDGKVKYDYERCKINTIKQLKANINYGLNNFELDKQA